MKKILLLILMVVLLYAVMNRRFLEAMAYLHDGELGNDTKAVSLLKLAVDEDRDSKSAFLLGYYYKTAKYQALDLVASHHYYLIASELGDHEAKMLVAWNFYKGRGCTKNIAKAKALLTELAIAGNSKAQEVLKFVIRN